MPAKKKRRKHRGAKSTEPIARLARKAYQLIARGSARWGNKELDESYAVRESVAALLGTESVLSKAERSYQRRKAQGFLRELGKISVQVRQRNSQARSGTGNPNDHPDRNRIADYRAAGGRIRWATRK
jgi:hypothetical protein